MAQFGHNNKFITKIQFIKSNKQYGLTELNKIINKYFHELERTVLYFIYKDGFFNSSFFCDRDVFYNIKPWEVIDIQKSEMVDSGYNQYLTSLENLPQAQEDGCLIPAHSKDGGFILTRLDKFTEEFIKYSLIKEDCILTIGSGYGLPERIAILLGVKEVICNDICSYHLNTIKNLTPISLQNKLKFIEGDFKDIELPENSMKVIGIFRLLHFFGPQTLKVILEKIYFILEPGGILVLSAETPFLGNWKNFLPIYESRINKELNFPGFDADTMFEDKGYSKKLPKKMHLLDQYTINKVLKDIGFSIIKCEYFGRASTFPHDSCYDGRESIGAVAQKN